MIAQQIECFLGLCQKIKGGGPRLKHLGEAKILTFTIKSIPLESWIALALPNSHTLNALCLWMTFRTLKSCYDKERNSISRKDISVTSKRILTGGKGTMYHSH